MLVYKEKIQATEDNNGKISKVSLTPLSRWA